MSADRCFLNRRESASIRGHSLLSAPADSTHEFDHDTLVSILTEGTSMRGVMEVGKELVAATVVACAWGQAPVADERNGPLPGGLTHFQMPAYQSLAEWEKRAEHL